MSNKVANRFASVEIFGLYALAITLPLAETPMHAAFILFVIGSLGRRWCLHSWRRPDVFEWLLLAMAGIALASTVANWPLARGLSGLRNYVTLYVLFWITYRSDYRIDQMRKFFWFLVSAVVVGLLYGLWELQSGASARLEIHSAGVVTQSAIYLGEALFVMLGGYLDKNFLESGKSRFVILCAIIFSVVCLFIMGSRGSLLGVVCGLLFLGVCIKFNKRFFVVTGGILVVLSVLGFFVVMARPESHLLTGVTHLISNVGADGVNFEGEQKSDLVRYENWRIGYSYAMHGKHPLLGIGPRNYGSINIEQLPVAASLQTYPGMWTKLNHAHNLFLTKWCEEGLLGLVAFVLFLSGVVWVLLRSRLSACAITWYWVAALGSLNVFVVAGSFNSAFNDEFAWLAMIIMGYAMGQLHHRRYNEGEFGA